MKPAPFPANPKVRDLSASIEIRQIKERDFAAVADLNPWELKKKQPLYPRWLHASAPVPGTAWGAFHGKKTAAYFGTAAVMLKTCEVNVPAHHGDLFVHGLFRGPQYNIFQRLIKSVVAEVAGRRPCRVERPLDLPQAIFEPRQRSTVAFRYGHGRAALHHD